MFISYTFPTLLESIQPGLQKLYSTGIALTKGPSDLLVAKSNKRASVFTSLVLLVAQCWFSSHFFGLSSSSLCHVCVSQRSALGPLFLSTSSLFKGPHPYYVFNDHLYTNNLICIFLAQIPPLNSLLIDLTTLFQYLLRAVLKGFSNLICPNLHS